MPRRARADEPESWHHIYNRGIARRTIFEQREDYRQFLSEVGRAVRRGEIEVHAYCLMSTHYHLLVRSPRGVISDAMHRIQLSYSRWFNRSRRRDGTLVRSRYGSKRVRGLTYRRILVRYIDANPRSARLVRLPSRYPWGSAQHYARPSKPPWLERSWIESCVVERCGLAAYDPAAYAQTFQPGDESGLIHFVHSRLDSRCDVDPLDDVLAAADPATRSWMIRKALLADGTKPGLPLSSIQALRGAIAGWSAPSPDNS